MSLSDDDTSSKMFQAEYTPVYTSLASTRYNSSRTAGMNTVVDHTKGLWKIGGRGRLAAVKFVYL
jgi:hypothetical protein